MQMLLNGTDTSLLVLNKLSIDELLAGVARAWRRNASSIGCSSNARERRKGNRGRRRWKRSSRGTLSEI